MKKFTFLMLFAFANILFATSAFGQITHIGSESAETSSSTLTITKPAGLAIGHLMIATITQSDNDGANGGDLSDATRLGWTVIDGREIGNSGSGGDEWYGTVLYKFADAADVAASDFAFTLDSDADDGVGGISAFGNVDLVNPFDVTPGTLNLGSADDITAPSITTVTANAAIVMVSMIGDNRTHSGWNTGAPGSLSLTELYDDADDADLDEGVASAWATKVTAGATGDGDAELSGGGNTFFGSMLLALRPGVSVANLWSVAGTDAIRKYTVNPNTGAIIYGPTEIDNPITSTAAVGKVLPNLNDVDGCIYYLDRDDAGTKNGVVTIYSMRPDGTGHGSRGTIDMNGAGNNSDFSFVRLGFTASGTGWIIAGDGSTALYIASFQGNGVNAISAVNDFGNATLTVAAPGSISEFQNGDLAISAAGVLYALANVSNGQTYVYTLNSLVSPTTLTRKWTVQDNGGTFSGSVNGLAWTQTGSLHFSTSSGIYFIDQFTANTVSGTVQATFVEGSGGLSLTDLASDKFPSQSTLPVTLISFNGSLHNQVTTLNWVTENISNFDRFEIERSSNGSSFSSVGLKYPSGDPATRTSYTHYDNLAGVSGNVFYYRLKMIDADGQYKYSNVILVRKDIKGITGIVLNPNPVRDNTATLRFDAEQSATVEIRIMDLSGKLVLKQQNQVYKGTNSVSVGNLGSLQPGTYLIQLQEGGNVQTTKFIIAR